MAKTCVRCGVPFQQTTTGAKPDADGFVPPVLLIVERCPRCDGDVYEEAAVG